MKISDKRLDELIAKTRNRRSQGGYDTKECLEELRTLRERHKTAVKLLKLINGNLEELYRHGDHPWRPQVRAFLAGEQT